MELRQIPETNYDAPSLHKAVVISTVFIHITTGIFILIRAYANTSTRHLQPEDIFSYIAWVALIVQTGLIVQNSAHGMSQHLWDIDLPTLFAGFRRYNVIFMFYTISGGFAKATVFLQLKKIFTTALRGPVYWVIMGSLFVNAVAYIAFLFLYIFTCWPREKIWNPMVPGHCMDSNKLNMAIGALNTLSDIEAFLVPTWAVWQLRLDIRKKLSVFAVFAVGALAVAIGCMGMYYRVLILRTRDKTWFLMQTAIICMAELGIVIVVGCCPCIPRILHRRRRNHSSDAETNTRGRHSSFSWKSKQRALQRLRMDDSSLLSDTNIQYELHNFTGRTENATNEKTSCTAKIVDVQQEQHHVERI